MLRRIGNNPYTEVTGEWGYTSWFRFACATIQGWRTYQEDAYSCLSGYHNYHHRHYSPPPPTANGSDGRCGGKNGKGKVLKSAVVPSALTSHHSSKGKPTPLSQLAKEEKKEKEGEWEKEVENFSLPPNGVVARGVVSSPEPNSTSANNSSNDSCCSLFAVFDGHAGGEVARYTAAEFPTFLLENGLHEALANVGKIPSPSKFIPSSPHSRNDNKYYDSDNDDYDDDYDDENSKRRKAQLEPVCEALRRGFMAFDAHLRQPEVIERMGALCNAAKEIWEEEEEAGARRTTHVPGFNSGTTACMALLLPHHGMLAIANAGDSRAVFIRNGRVVAQSYDHLPHNPLEYKRIEKAGSFVCGDRVLDVASGTRGLNLSRALGDHYYKQKEELPADEQIIIAMPKVKLIDLMLPDAIPHHSASLPSDSSSSSSDKDFDWSGTRPPTSLDQLLVLASDGIWGVMSNQSVADFITQRRRSKPLSEIAAELCTQCLAPKLEGYDSGCDNNTVIIIDFGNLIRRSIASSFPQHKIKARQKAAPPPSVVFALSKEIIAERRQECGKIAKKFPWPPLTRAYTTATTAATVAAAANQPSNSQPAIQLTQQQQSQQELKQGKPSYSTSSSLLQPHTGRGETSSGEGSKQPSGQFPLGGQQHWQFPLLQPPTTIGNNRATMSAAASGSGVRQLNEPTTFDEDSAIYSEHIEKLVEKLSEAKSEEERREIEGEIRDICSQRVRIPLIGAPKDEREQYFSHRPSEVENLLLNGGTRAEAAYHLSNLRITSHLDPYSYKLLLDYEEVYSLLALTEEERNTYDRIFFNDRIYGRRSPADDAYLIVTGKETEDVECMTIVTAERFTKEFLHMIKSAQELGTFRDKELASFYDCMNEIALVLYPEDPYPEEREPHERKKREHLLHALICECAQERKLSSQWPLDLQNAYAMYIKLQRKRLLGIAKARANYLSEREVLHKAVCFAAELEPDVDWNALYQHEFRLYNEWQGKAAAGNQIEGEEETGSDETPENPSDVAFKHLLLALTCKCDAQPYEWPAPLYKALMSEDEWNQRYLLAGAQKTRSIYVRKAAIEAAAEKREKFTPLEKALYKSRVVVSAKKREGDKPILALGCKTFEEHLEQSTVVIDRTGVAVRLMTGVPNKVGLGRHNIILTSDGSGKTHTLSATHRFVEFQVDPSTGEKLSRERDEESSTGSVAQRLAATTLEKKSATKKRHAGEPAEETSSTSVKRRATEGAVGQPAASTPIHLLNSPTSSHGRESHARALTPKIQLECSKQFGTFGQFEAERDEEFLQRSYLNHPLVTLDFGLAAKETCADMVESLLVNVIKPELDRQFEERGLLNKLARERDRLLRPVLAGRGKGGSALAADQQKKQQSRAQAIQNDIDFYHSYVAMRRVDAQANEGNISDSLRVLCRILNERYNEGRRPTEILPGNRDSKGVVLLIDNATAPMLSARSEWERRKIEAFLGRLLNGAQDYVARTLAMGSLYLPEEFKIYFLRGSGAHTIMGNQLQEYFMLTERDFDALGKIFGVCEEVLTEAKLFYNGYQVGRRRDSAKLADAETPSGQQRAGSTINYLQLVSALSFFTSYSGPAHKMQSYWRAGNFLTEFEPCFHDPCFRDRLSHLVATKVGGDKDTPFQRVRIESPFFDIQKLVSVRNKMGEGRMLDALDTDDVNTLFELFTYLGLFAVAADNFTPTSPDLVVIPNYEIRSHLARRLTDSFNRAEKATFNALVGAFHPFRAEKEGGWDVEEFLEKLTAHLQQIDKGGAGSGPGVSFAAGCPPKVWTEDTIKGQIILAASAAGIRYEPEYPAPREYVAETDLLLNFFANEEALKKVRNKTSNLVETARDANSGKIDTWLFMLQGFFSELGLFMESKRNNEKERDLGLHIKKGLVQDCQYQPPPGFHHLKFATYLCIGVDIFNGFECQYLMVKKELVNGKWKIVDGSLTGSIGLFNTNSKELPRIRREAEQLRRAKEQRKQQQEQLLREAQKEADGEE